MKWIWPYSWWLRIKVLEAKNRELVEDLRRAALQQTALAITYTSAMASVSSMINRVQVCDCCGQLGHSHCVTVKR